MKEIDKMKTFNLIDETYEEMDENYEDAESSEEQKDPEEEVKEEKEDIDDGWQMFGELKVDDSYAIGDIYGMKNIYENFSKDVLNTKMYEIYKKSPYYGKYNTKKPLKSDILEIVIYFLDELGENNNYSMCEKIVAIADIMRIDYLTLYNEMPSKIRYEIIKELDESFSVSDNRSKKLL